MLIEWKENIRKFLLQLFDNGQSDLLISIISEKPVVYYLGDKFSQEFMDYRVRKDIYLKSLRLTQDNYDLDCHKDYSWYKKEIRHIASDKFRENIFLYAHKAYIFNMKNMTLFIEGNIEIYNHYLSQFHNLWDIEE